MRSQSFRNLGRDEQEPPRTFTSLTFHFNLIFDTKHLQLQIKFQGGHLDQLGRRRDFLFV
jgi:hypothetical protein